jgi:hypothetical protein
VQTGLVFVLELIIGVVYVQAVPLRDAGYPFWSCCRAAETDRTQAAQMIHADWTLVISDGQRRILTSDIQWVNMGTVGIQWVYNRYSGYTVVRLTYFGLERGRRRLKLCQRESPACPSIWLLGDCTSSRSTQYDYCQYCPCIGDGLLSCTPQGPGSG